MGIPEAMKIPGSLLLFFIAGACAVSWWGLRSELNRERSYGGVISGTFATSLHDKEKLRDRCGFTALCCMFGMLGMFWEWAFFGIAALFAFRFVRSAMRAEPGQSFPDKGGPWDEPL